MKKGCWWEFGGGRGGRMSASRARTPKPGAAVFVAILPDSGDKYLSERFWKEGYISQADFSLKFFCMPSASRGEMFSMLKT